MPIPDGFWWGTAASSTQAEGAAPASDWAAIEAAGRAPRSGDGNGFGTRYAEDFAVLADHGLAHHRLSLEWARLEPEPGHHDAAAIEHYRDVLTAARDLGVAAWACLHHFTLPGWFSVDERGFPDRHSREYFWPRHVEFVAETFGDLVFGWQPVNEPTAYAFLGWRGGGFAPGRNDAEQFAEALEAIHLATFDAALRLRQTGKPVASINNLSPIFPIGTGDAAEAEARARRFDERMWGCWIGAVRGGTFAVPGRAPIERPELRDAFDLIGFSYYNAVSMGADGRFGRYPLDGTPGPLGYVPWSEGLYHVLARLSEELPGVPLLVAEHGIGTTDDAWREAFLRDSLGHLVSAIDDGADVRGFFHWTAVDNYEWLAGFDVPFGLFDRERTPKGSAALAAAWALGELP